MFFIKFILLFVPLIMLSFYLDDKYIEMRCKEIEQDYKKGGKIKW